MCNLMKKCGENWINILNFAERVQKGARPT